MKIKEQAPFPVIWEKLDRFERTEVLRQIVADGHTGTTMTARNWAIGKSKPVTPSVREGVAASVSKVIGCNVTAKVLFS